MQVAEAQHPCWWGWKAGGRKGAGGPNKNTKAYPLHHKPDKLQTADERLDRTSPVYDVASLRQSSDTSCNQLHPKTLKQLRAVVVAVGVSLAHKWH